MDNSTAKMKQKPINAFFAASAKKDDPAKSTQRKISVFFGGATKVEQATGSRANGAAKTPDGPMATPPGAAAPTGRLSLDPNTAGDLAMGEGAGAAAAAAAAPAEVKTVPAVKPAKAPAGGSTSKPKAPTAAGHKVGKPCSKTKGDKAKEEKAKGDKATASAGGCRKRLRRVVMDDEGGDTVEAGLEDDVDDKDKLEDSDYEAEKSEGSSDEDFSADEESDGAEGAAESDGDDVAAVGAKRKRPSSKSCAPAKRGAAKAVGHGVRAVQSTPARKVTPSCAARSDALTTPHHGTASKGPASATAGAAGGRSAVTTPGTVAPALGSHGAACGRSPGGPNVLTPSSARSTQSTLADTPSKSQGGGSELSLGVAASMEGEAARFADRMAARFAFLHPDNLRDAQQRRPDHPDYDPRTLHIPTNWFKEFKVSEGQQQWWNFKAQNFDSVLLFKMGKFYEMFEMDAYVGVEVLGLTFMKGEQPHAGFPEVKYADMAESLARAGYRVVVVEQTETPEMLAKRNEERKRQGKKMVNVVDRQKVAVLSRGTLVDAEMVASRPDASYVLAVSEAEMEGGPEAAVGGGGVVRIGLCAVDAASGQVLLGEFVDDEVRSTLRTQLTSLQPQELVLPRKALSSTTAHVLRNGLRDPRVTMMKGAAGDWSAEKTYRMLRDAEYFTASAAAPTAPVGDDEHAAASGSPLVREGAYGASEEGVMDMDLNGDTTARPSNSRATAAVGASRPELDPAKRWPALLRRMVADGVSSRPAAMAALAGIITFLRDSLLDRAVLPLGRFEELPALSPREGAAGPDPASEGPQYMALNGAALENLEILENGDGGSAGTLLSVLDNCATPFGRRRLRQWLCRPLGRIADIEERQDAVAALGGPLAEAAGQARKQLAGVSDLERAVARLHASTVSGASGRDAANVVLYEDAGKRRVAAFTAALRDLRAAHGALARLRKALEARGGEGEDGGGGSALLRRIAVGRCRHAEVGAALAALEGATDWKEAAATGRAVPGQGVDEEYDATVEAVEAIERKMQDYLKELRQRFGREVVLVSVNKDSHLLEVPDSLAGRLGREFNLVGNRKGYKRFTTARLKDLVAQHEAATERKESVLSGILTRLLINFVSHKSLWVAVVEAVAELDALMSLTAHAMSPPDGGPMCRPRLVPPPRAGGGCSPGGYSGKTGTGSEPCPVFDAVALRHPAGIGGRNNGAFVPNDVRLGGDQPPFILLSGPNMGGKSTLLRQTCLATLLAQIGACVPAESLTLSPVDAIFVRMGARDAIMTGQSTFFIELAETAAMLTKATSNSLVALDELGRGTATLDGAAVAGAVLQHLATKAGCRGLFATHYHHLSDEHADDPRVAVMHMACAVEGAQGEEAEAAGDDAEQQRKQGGGSASGSEEVTFLYRLTHGACPKSYGTNVARLAGLPPRVVMRAAEVSAQWNNQQEQQPESSGGAEAMEVDCGAKPAIVPVASSNSPVVAVKEKMEDLKALVAEIRQGCRSQGDQQQLDVSRLRQLQAEAASLVTAVGRKDDA